MAALKHFYNDLGDKLWGKYGFYDAFSEQAEWYSERLFGHRPADHRSDD